VDLLLEENNGFNLLLRDQSVPLYYPPATVPAARVEIYQHDIDQPASAARLIATVAPGATISIPYTPSTDKPTILRALSFSASGTPSHASLDDAPAMTVLFQRETDAPTVQQVGAATNTQIQIAFDNYSQFVVRRRIRIADNAEMTNAVERVTTSQVGQMPRLAFIARATAGTNAQTIFIRVSHCNSETGNAWSAESDALSLSFANSTGGGGSSGDGDEFARDRYSY